MTTIRPAHAGDLGRIRKIEDASYGTPWSFETFRSVLGRDGVTFLVAEAGRAVLGYVVAQQVADEAEIANLAVAAPFRRRGIGTALLDRVLDEIAASGIRSVFLEVRWSNDGAIALYESRGFEQIAVRKRYYERPVEHARVLRLALPAVLER